jgi:hypothetical protein
MAAGTSSCRLHLTIEDQGAFATPWTAMELSCAFAPEGLGRREDYGDVTTKFELDVGIIGGG